MSVTSSAVRPGRLVLLALIFSAGSVRAQQDVIAPAGNSPATILPQPVVAQGQGQSDLTINPRATLIDTPYQWGPFYLRPHFLYRFLYGDGIQAGPGHPSTTTINTISPGFLLGIGSYWTLDYAPTWDIYSNSAFKDTLEHSIILLAARSYENWDIGFSQSYLYSAEPLVETGRQTSEQNFNTDLTLTHRFTQQLSLQSDLNQDVRYTVGYPNSDEWFVSNSLHYRFSPLLDAAAGVTVGYVAESEGSNNGYIRPVGQLTWKPTDKLSVDVIAGAEHREYYGDPRTSLNTPVYNLSINYVPIEPTKLSFNAGRQVAPALFADQSSRSTQWSASIDQRLLEHYRLSASVGNGQVAYLNDQDPSVANRNDTVTTYSLQLSTTFLKRGTIALIYDRSHNTSSTVGYGFTSSQIGFELGFKY